MFRHLLVLLLLLAPLTARGDYREFRAVPVDAALGAKLTRVADTTLKEFPKLTAGNFTLSVIDLTKPESVVRADYHGDASFYPSSLVKLFFMVETYHQGHITPEIERALREMIQASDNDAAAFLLDEALQQFYKAQELAPSDADIRTNLGLMLARQGKLSEATAQLNEALRLNPTSAEAHNNLGLIFLLAVQPEKSLPHFATALDRKPNFTIARDNLRRAQSQIDARQK